MHVKDLYNVQNTTKVSVNFITQEDDCHEAIAINQSMIMWSKGTDLYHSDYFRRTSKKYEIIFLGNQPSLNTI